MTIDTELSKLDDDEVRILNYVYKEIAYSPKMPYFAGNPKFAMQKLDFTEPNIENIIVGATTALKSHGQHGVPILSLGVFLSSTFETTEVKIRVPKI